MGPGSGCCDAARDELSAAIFATGVPVRAGIGLWALGVFPNAGAGDYKNISKYLAKATFMPYKPQRIRLPL